MEKIIEGKIEYNNEKYGFYYINNILTLIPDNALEDVWESIFSTLKERTVDTELLLEGITSSGHRIMFINVKLVKQSGGLYKAFVPAYIIGKTNMMKPLPVIDNFNSIVFYGKCIDNFLNPQKTLSLEDFDTKDKKIKLKKILNKNIEIENDIFNMGINYSLKCSEKNINTPLIVKSFLEIKFKDEKNVKEIVKYYRKVGELFKFLYSRKYIRFTEIKLTSKGKVRDGKEIKDILNTFDFYYYLPDEDKIDLPEEKNCIKYEQIKDYLGNIYLTVNKESIYKNYYNLNQEEQRKITINKYANISSAFESWFDENFPKFKSDTNENYKMLKNKVLDFIKKCIDEEVEDENKEILSWFKHDINNMEGSLKEQIKYALNLFEGCIKNAKNNVVKQYNIEYSSEEELNEKIANTFKETRNKIAHGNLKDEILFSDMDVVAYSIVERLVKCLALYKSKVDIDTIKEILDDRF